MSVELTINVHDSYSDCEMCGSYSNDILSVHSDSHRDFGEYHSGTSAHCYDVEEANYYEFCNEILNRLESIGCGIPRPEWKPRPVNEELEQRYKTAIIDRGLLDRTVHPTWANWPKDTVGILIGNMIIIKTVNSKMLIMRSTKVLLMKIILIVSFRI